MQGFTQDARYALRQARRYPMFTLIVTLAIALGIGAATALVVIALIASYIPARRASTVDALLAMRAD